MEKKIAQRLNTRAMGYGRLNADRIDRGNLMQYITPQDLKSFGLIPELVGRLPVLTYMQPLSREALRSICEAIMMDTMFDIPSTDARKFTVTLPYAKKKIEKANILELKQVG